MKNILFILLFVIISCDDKYSIKIEDKEFIFEFKNTEAANQIKSKLPFSLKMKNLNGNEVYYYFDESFKSNDKSVGNINVGDIYLYDSDCLVLFYKSFSTGYKYTEIGGLVNSDGLENVIGNKDVIVYWCLNDKCSNEINYNSFVKNNLFLLLIILMLL